MNSKYRLHVVLAFFLSFSLLDSSAGARPIAVGDYRSGALENGADLLDAGFPMHKIFVQRKRSYGTAELLDVLEKLAVLARNLSGAPLQIGDLSERRGGLAKGHQSHQNGLDVDIVYLGHRIELQDPGAKWWREEFVQNGQLTPNFDLTKNWELLKFAGNLREVRLIFVDKKIKEALCSHAWNTDEQSRIALSKLVPEPGHGNHLHLRLRCPSGHRCVQDGRNPESSPCAP